MRSPRQYPINLVHISPTEQHTPAPPTIGPPSAGTHFAPEYPAPGATPPEYMTPRQVMAMTVFSLKALEVMRHRRKGPRWIKIGSRIRYRRADVIAWMESGGLSGIAE